MFWKEYFFPIGGQGGLRSGGLSKLRVPLADWFNGCRDNWMTPGEKNVNRDASWHDEQSRPAYSHCWTSRH